jgi:hypothetical protein
VVAGFDVGDSMTAVVGVDVRTGVGSFAVARATSGALGSELDGASPKSESLNEVNVSLKSSAP